jgi:hypothetical protein
MNANVGGCRPQDIAGLNVATSTTATRTTTASTPEMSSAHLHRAKPLSLFGVKALDLCSLDGGTSPCKIDMVMMKFRNQLVYADLCKTFNCISVI